MNFPSVLANAFAFSLSFSVGFPFKLITGLLLVVWDFLPLILLTVFQSILLSLASSRSFVFFSPPGVLIVYSLLWRLLFLVGWQVFYVLGPGFFVLFICLFNLINQLICLDMKKSISLTLLLGHDLSKASLIIFSRTQDDFFILLKLLVERDVVQWL